MLPRLKTLSLSFYEHYVISKQHRLRFNRSTKRSKDIIDLVYSDVWESFVTSLRGADYLVLFVDDYFKRCWVYPIERKSNVSSVFKAFKVHKELEMGKKIKCLRIDNRGEFCS